MFTGLLLSCSGRSSYTGRWTESFIPIFHPWSWNSDFRSSSLCSCRIMSHRGGPILLVLLLFTYFHQKRMKNLFTYSIYRYLLLNLKLSSKNTAISHHGAWDRHFWRREWMILIYLSMKSCLMSHIVSSYF